MQNYLVSVQKSGESGDQEMADWNFRNSDEGKNMILKVFSKRILKVKSIWKLGKSSWWAKRRKQEIKADHGKT